MNQSTTIDLPTNVLKSQSSASVDDDQLAYKSADKGDLPHFLKDNSISEYGLGTEVVGALSRSDIVLC